MPRPLRIEYPGAVYHVMNRGLARQPVFRDPTDFETFLQVLKKGSNLLLTNTSAHAPFSE